MRSIVKGAPLRGFILQSSLLVACSAHLSESHLTTPGQSVGDARTEAEEAPQPLVIRLYIMSQCPYCADLIAELAPFVRELGETAQLQVDYVGWIDDDGPASLHGPTEVLGNTIELCVQQHASVDRWLRFLECYQRQWDQIPDGWEDCSEEADIELSQVATCVEQGEGLELLEASIRRSEDVGLAATPTLVVGDVTLEGWRTPQVLSQLICAQFDTPLPEPCELVDPLPYVPVTVLTDERCDDPGCNIDAQIRALKSVIWGAEVNRLTYQSEPGRALYKSAQLGRLPAVVIGAELGDHREAFRELAFLRKSGPYYVNTFGRFDPKQGMWIPSEVVSAKLLNDQRCPPRECSADEFVGALKGVLPGLKVSDLDYSSDEGRALYKQLRLQAVGGYLSLPLMLFSESVEEEEELFEMMSEHLVPSGNSWLLPLGAWNPTQELCDNNVDDDENGQTDCSDEACSNSRLCRPLKNGRLELFVMSQCPYATSVMSVIDTVVDHFGRDRSKIDLTLTYLGGVNDEGELEAMHGQSEVDENLRQVCAQHLYKRGYQFVDYLACRAASYTSDDWEQCVTPPLKAKAINRCAKGVIGKRLLRKSYESAKQLHVTSSPGWLLNNRYPMRARTAGAIVAAFCERNPLPECEQEMVEADDSVNTNGGCE